VNTLLASHVRCETIAPSRAVRSLSEDVALGLFAEQRTLPPKYFYDQRGSALFDQICDLPEYYPTRTEGALLKRVATRIIEYARPQCIVELGSGTSRKTRHLLDACAEQQCYPEYAPFDVCDEILRTTGEALCEEYDWLAVHPMVGDYTAGLGNLPRRAQRNLMVFLGGTIGNFTLEQSQEFLREVRATMQSGDSLLLGADRIKAPEILHAAYNDDAGYTAAFNLNLLCVLNRELGADFDLDGFAHYAHYNPLASQIEMHLISVRDQRVRFAELDQSIDFNEGDHILTEISRKFTRPDIERNLAEAGFTVAEHYESSTHKFSLVLANPT
jgi:L-histidine Nalpha-methyltransferase